MTAANLATFATPVRWLRTRTAAVAEVLADLLRLGDRAPTLYPISIERTAGMPRVRRQA